MNDDAPLGAPKYTPSDWTVDEFRDALAASGWTQNGLARYLGANERTVRRWASGDQPVPLYAQRAIEQQVEIRQLQAALPASKRARAKAK